MRSCRGKAALGLLAVALCAVACGGEDRFAKQEGLEHVRVFAQPHLSGAPLLLADAEGYFRDEGIAIDWVTTGSSRDLLPPLLEGDVDVLTSNLSPVFLNAIAQGGRLRIVADKGHLARDGCTYLAFLTRPELLRDGRLVPPPDGARLRVSYRRGSLYDLLFERALVATGIPREATELHFLSGQVENQALAQGSLDITTTSGPAMQALVDSGRAAIWLRAQDLLPDGQAFVIIFGPTLLDRNPELGTRFMTAYLRGVRRYNLGRTESNVATLAKALGVTREELEVACWIPIREDGGIHTPTIDELTEWGVANGRVVRRLAIEEVWEPRFVEAAVARLDDSPGGNGGTQSRPANASADMGSR